MEICFQSSISGSLRGTLLLQVHQLLFDLLQIQLCRKTIKMQHKIKNAMREVVQRDQALSADDNLFLQSFVKTIESYYLSRRAPNQGSSLLLHDVHSCIVLVY